MAPKNFPYEDFTRYIGVSRETFARLQSYTEILQKWQAKINLIGPATLNEIWTRHIIDSSQLFSYISAGDSVIDIGSGAGLPGLILAIMGAKDVTLTESDVRKVAFLREANRVTKARATVLHARAETIDLRGFSVVVARAFAPLARMLELLGSTLRAGHKILILKGKKHDSEIRIAQERWNFDYVIHPSVIEKEAVILSIENLTRR